MTPEERQKAVRTAEDWDRVYFATEEDGRYVRLSRNVLDDGDLLARTIRELAWLITPRFCGICQVEVLDPKCPHVLQSGDLVVMRKQIWDRSVEEISTMRARIDPANASDLLLSALANINTNLREIKLVLDQGLRRTP